MKLVMALDRIVLSSLVKEHKLVCADRQRIMVEIGVRSDLKLLLGDAVR